MHADSRSSSSIMVQPIVDKLDLGHAKLISCSTEHQGNEVGSVGRKENK